MAFAGPRRAIRNGAGGGYAGRLTVHKSMDRLLPHHDRQPRNRPELRQRFAADGCVQCIATLATERPNEIEDLTGLQAIAMQLQQTTRRRSAVDIGRRRFCLRGQHDGYSRRAARQGEQESSLLGAGISTRGGTLDGPEARAIHEIGEEPVDVNWSGYYHQLRAEGVIIVEESGNDARG